MQTIHEVIIEKSRVVTSHGQYPFNEHSAVWVRSISSQQTTKKIIAGGLFLAGVATGGLALFLGAPAAGLLLSHDSVEVVLSTDGTEFVIRRFTSAIGCNKEDAAELKDAIAEAIAKALEE